ncbi:hypothetical protein AM501_09920 [Aneurinibacillus migulanus]|uniref:hypothetical protein n=1 Tax=Aneurinibacillus migulanus TaxID=47500 RepID=UPI0005BA7297|nr:hypothetical protein [Aneurinibacillus migulanus]KIV56461.1 hypothetical protein TS64_09335 [Aneurinibacillus migulanus]KPD08469.1 hypothetical protein AM501_09920 [Aneurinibacillus migulanus]
MIIQCTPDCSLTFFTFSFVRWFGVSHCINPLNDVAASNFIYDGWGGRLPRAPRPGPTKIIKDNRIN